MQDVYVVVTNASNDMYDYNDLQAYSNSDYAIAAFNDIVTNFKTHGDDCIRHPPYMYGQFVGRTDEHNWTVDITLEDDLPSYSLVDADNSQFYYKVNIIKLNVIK